MEAITRIVADSLARHGLDRPIDPRRLQWSRWSRCDSPHSLLIVPSKPGIFALAEEVIDLAPGNNNLGTAALACPAEQSSAELVWDRVSDPVRPSKARLDLAGSTTTPATRRMLAVLHFSEDDDMAFTLDRMFTCVNPMRSRLSSGRCFLRFVVIEDGNQRQQHLQCSEPMADQLGRKGLQPASRLPVVAGTGECRADALVRHRRQHPKTSPSDAVDQFDDEPSSESGFRGQQKPSLSSPPPLRFLNRRAARKARELANPGKGTTSVVPPDLALKGRGFKPRRYMSL